MNKRLKHLVLFLSLVIMSTLVLACKPTKSNPQNKDSGLEFATFYDNVEKYAYATYLQDNATKFPFDGSELPFDIVNVIRTQSELDKAIPDGHIEIDFNKEVLVLYLFTDIYMGFNCRLKSINVKGNQLNIVIFHELAEKSAQGTRPPSTSYPTQRCMAIKTTLTDFNSASVAIDYPN